MMHMATTTTMNASPFRVEDASISDLDSLSTILARSFHPVNPYIKETIPDTPATRTWWKAVFKNSIEYPKSHVLIAVDTTSASTPRKALGILMFRLMAFDEPGRGLWASVPPTSDHHGEKYNNILGALDARERIMRTAQTGARPHSVIELFGVDHEYKGQGLGGMLLRRACEVADDAGYETFVQANASAVAMYCHVGGFEVRERVVLEGGYEEGMLVRPVRAQERRTAEV
ncbi:hypothetical protein EJ03DRAFT_3964 [Teratosphaeria nubilosa]|uniref:N-acetyltransferase domain-containing protein n=1 Tax=Teratosphaeria nubilosa TaxID=161662 RepID=A0A6G1LQ49_9PEZI|nr:hypothetical protein EJ03DRAFT_3964 [Teratosphaeria nubilosa]